MNLQKCYIVLIEGMEKRKESPQVIVVNGTKFIDVSTRFFSIL